MNKLRISVVVVFWLFPILVLAQTRELPSPAGAGSGQPNLAVSPDGRAHLSWIERLGEGRFSLLSEKGIRVLSMRNKANRLEELFLRLVEGRDPGSGQPVAVPAVAAK